VEGGDDPERVAVSSWDGRFPRNDPDWHPEILAAGRFKRPIIVTVLAVWCFVSPAARVLSLLSIPHASFRTYSSPFAMILFAICALQMASGYGLWTLHSNGRRLLLTLTVLAIPIAGSAAIINCVFAFWYFWKPGVRALFSGKSPSQFSPSELREIAAVTAVSPWTVVVVVLLIAGGVMELVELVSRGQAKP
jgi:hypothetical protein